MKESKMDKPGYVSELVDEWLFSNEYHIARSTYVKYEQLANHYVVPFFRKVPCGELDQECLLTFSAEISRKQMSSGNRRTIFMIVNHALEQAYTSNKLEQKFYIRPHLSKEKNVVHVFREDDQKKLEMYAFDHVDRYSLAILLGLFTGLRIGEICALQWKDVCFETDSLHVNKTVQRLPVKNQDLRTELTVSSPKSASACRLIPLPDFLVDYLRKFPRKGEEAFLLTNQAGAPMEPRTLQYHYKKILRELGIPYLNFHCLRHTFATRCVTAGWDMKTLSEILGHSDIKVTMEYYFHSSFEYKKEQMNKIILLSQN